MNHSVDQGASSQMSDIDRAQRDLVLDERGKKEEKEKPKGRRNRK